MAVSEKQKKRQKILLIVLGVAIIIALATFYNLKKKPASEKSQAGEAPASTISVEEKKLKEVKLELDVLDSELFQALKSHGILPVVPGETGRPDPFQPPF